MAEPLPTFNINQLTNSVALAFNNGGNAHPKTPTTPPKITSHSPTTTCTTPVVPGTCSIVRPNQTVIPLNSIAPVSVPKILGGYNRPLIPMVMLTVGGQPTLVALGEQFSAAKITSAIPLQQPFPTNIKSTAHQQLPSCKPLPTGYVPQQVNQETNSLQHLPGHIPIQPKLPASVSTTHTVVQSSGPADTASLASRPPVSSPSTSSVSAPQALSHTATSATAPYIWSQTTSPATGLQVLSHTASATGPVLSHSSSATGPVLPHSASATRPVLSYTASATGPVLPHSSSATGPVLSHSSSATGPVLSHSSSATGPVLPHTSSSATGPVLSHSSSATGPVLSHSSSATGPVLSYTASATGPVLSYTASATGPVLSHSSSATGPVLPHSSSSGTAQHLSKTPPPATGLPVLPHIPSCVAGPPVLPQTAASATGSQVLSHTANPSSGSQVLPQTGPPPAGPQVFTYTASPASGPQVLSHTAPPATGSQVLPQTGPPPAGPQVFTYTAPPARGSQVFAHTGPQLLSQTSSSFTTSQVPSNTASPATGPQIVSHFTPLSTALSSHVQRFTVNDIQTLINQYAVSPTPVGNPTIAQANCDQTSPNGISSNTTINCFSEPPIIHSTPPTDHPPPPNLLTSPGHQPNNSVIKNLLDGGTLGASPHFTDCPPVGQLGLESLSPNGIYHLTGDREVRGDTPTNGYLLSNTWTGNIFDLPLEKPVPTNAAKDHLSSTDVLQPRGDHSEEIQNSLSFCLSCNKSSSRVCSIHPCTYSVIKDTPIPSRARLSLPSCLTLNQSSVSENLIGVYTKSTISSHTVFGPMIGEVKKAEDFSQDKTYNFTTWKVFDKDQMYILNMADEEKSNWMGFVKPARTATEQNLVVYQLGREMFFISLREISANEELLLWYAGDYAKALGLPNAPGAHLTCDRCTKSFPNAKALGRHHKYAHADTSTRKWKCDYCEHGFHSHSKLKSHILSHLGVKPYECLECGKKFTEKPNLTRHMYIHSDQRKFVCNTCGQGFRQKAHLQSHVFVHTKEKTITCRFCCKLFARTSDLKQHEYLHTREKVFTCSLCCKVFYKLSTFKKHSKIHAGQKDFECNKCEKRFFSRYHVKRHLLTCKGTKSVQYSLDPDNPSKLVS